MDFTSIMVLARPFPPDPGETVRLRWRLSMDQSQPGRCLPEAISLNSEKSSPLFPGKRSCTGVRCLLALIVLSCPVVVSCASGKVTTGHPVKEAHRYWPYSIRFEAQPETIYHLPTGQRVQFGEMMDVLEAQRIVYLGELHNSPEHHRIQLSVIESLQQRTRGNLLVGFEIFREPQQPLLDRWIQGEIDEQSFLARMYDQESGRRLLRAYLEILRYLQAEKIPLLALNPPQSLETRVRDRLPDTGALSQIPDLPMFGPGVPYQRSLLKKIYREHVPTGRGFTSFYWIHRLWEEHMAERIVASLNRDSSRKQTMVVVAGAFHVRWGLGVPRNVFRRKPVAYASLIPEPLESPGTVSSDSDTGQATRGKPIPLLPSTFVWWYEESSNRGAD